MSKREIRYLITLAVAIALLVGGAVLLISFQQSADRATQDEKALIVEREHALDLTATASSKP